MKKRRSDRTLDRSLWKNNLGCMYLRMGVDRVWIVDPDTRNVHVYRADREPQIVTLNDTLADPDVLPGFSCNVTEFFED